MDRLYGDDLISGPIDEHLIPTSDHLPTANAGFDTIQQDDMKQVMQMFSMLTEFGKWKSDRKMMGKTKSVTAQVRYYLGDATFPIDHTDRSEQGRFGHWRRNDYLWAAKA